MGKRQGSLSEVAPGIQLLNAISSLVDPVTQQYTFPSHEFFDSVKKIHAEGYTGSGEIIGIVDTGIDRTHPLLKGAVFDEQDFTDEGTSEDLHGHGTLVALITRFVAPRARIVNAKAFDKNGRVAERALSSALNWVRSKSPTVVNLSGGISEPDPAASVAPWLRNYLSGRQRKHWLVHLLRKHWLYSCPVCRAADRLWRSGTVVCVAVGNDRSRIICPGRGGRGGLIQIGAASISSGQPIVASYSAYWPDLVAPELHLVPGTSFSAPFVSGLSAVLAEVYEEKSPTLGASTLSRADVFFNARQFKDAIVAYQRVLKKNRHLAKHSLTQSKGGACFYCKTFIYTPRMKLAFSYMQSGEPLIAARFFEENVTIAPNFADAHMNLGAALRNAGLLEESIETYERAIALAPRKAEAFDGLAEAYCLQHAFSDAVEAFERSYNLNPTRIYPLKQLVKICIDFGDVEREEHYRAILSARGVNQFIV